MQPLRNLTWLAPGRLCPLCCGGFWCRSSWLVDNRTDCRTDDKLKNTRTVKNCMFVLYVCIVVSVVVWSAVTIPPVGGVVSSDVSRSIAARGRTPEVQTQRLTSITGGQNLSTVLTHDGQQYKEYWMSTVFIVLVLGLTMGLAPISISIFNLQTAQTWPCLVVLAAALLWTCSKVYWLCKLTWVLVSWSSSSRGCSCRPAGNLTTCRRK